MNVGVCLPSYGHDRGTYFRPGAGATPPALAGREVEQRVLSRCLADLAGGSAPPHDVVLLGPPPSATR